MRATDKFQDFLTDFLHLAGEAQIPATMYKDELMLDARSAPLPTEKKSVKFSVCHISLGASAA
jgi:hypothetical protein